jgi:hypothetical protein
VQDLELDWVEAVGYAASGLVFLTFYMKTLIPLRLVAIASNITFILYAFWASLTPVLILHCLLLPLNILRTFEQVLSYRRVPASADGQANVEALVPLMVRKSDPAGSSVFLKDEQATSIYYLSKGSVDIPELNKTLSPGTLFGEVGLFTPERRRTASAVCAEDSELLVVSDRDIVEHCLKEPAFGLYLTKLIAGRMAENLTGHLR